MESLTGVAAGYGYAPAPGMPMVQMAPAPMFAPVGDFFCAASSHPSNSLQAPVSYEPAPVVHRPTGLTRYNTTSASSIVE